MKTLNRYRTTQDSLTVFPIGTVLEVAPDLSAILPKQVKFVKVIGAVNCSGCILKSASRCSETYLCLAFSKDGDENTKLVPCTEKGETL